MNFWMDWIFWRNFNVGWCLSNMSVLLVFDCIFTMLLWCINLLWSTSVAMVILIAHSVDKYLKGKKWKHKSICLSDFVSEFWFLQKYLEFWIYINPASMTKWAMFMLIILKLFYVLKFFMNILFNQNIKNSCIKYMFIKKCHLLQM